jgi:hypothetical protein
MLVAFDLIGIVVPNMLAVVAAMLIDISDSAFSFCRIAKESLSIPTLLARDYEIPFERLTLR